MTTCSQIQNHPIRRTAPGGILARLRAGHAAWRQRRALANLDDAGLRDIGVSRAEARAEANRPVWDVPANWLR